MKKLLLYILGGIIALLVVGAIVIGGEPPQPPVTKSAPGLDTQFAGIVAKSAEPMRGVAFSPDGRELASIGVDGAVRITNLASGKTVVRFRHPGGGTAIAFSPDGRFVAAAGYDGAVRMWRLADGVGRRFAISSMPLWTLAFDPAGTHLAAAGEDKLIHLWPTESAGGERRFAGHTLNVWHIGFSPDGRTLASGSFDRTLRIWDVASGRLLRTSIGHRQGIVGLDVRHGDGAIVTGGDDATIRFWRPDGASVRTLGAGQFVDAVAFSHDGRWLASGGRESHGVNAVYKQFFGHRPGNGHGITVRLWRVADGAMVAALSDQKDDVVALAISPDGRWLASGSDDGTVALWKLTERPGETGK